MFKSLATVTVFALTTVAAPALADDVTPHEFNNSITQALGYLTVSNQAHPNTRDGQVGEGAYEGRQTLRNSTKSSRTRVFQQSDLNNSGALAGYRGFGATGFERIDR